MLKLFDLPWEEVPIAVVDVETTGRRPGADAVVQIAVVRFEKREIVGREVSFVNPGRAIPKEATAVHGIRAKDVKGAPSLAQVLARKSMMQLISGAQPVAYNSQFDRAFVPPSAFEDWTWPWLDPLVAVRRLDKYVRGTGRHKLEASCRRHGVSIEKVHDAGADAEATGHLLYQVFAKVPDLADATLGDALEWQMHTEAAQWAEYNRWRASNAGASA